MFRGWLCLPFWGHRAVVDFANEWTFAGLSANERRTVLSTGDRERERAKIEVGLQRFATVTLPAVRLKDRDDVALEKRSGLFRTDGCRRDGKQEGD
jgi:hypothetical protein